MPRLIALLAALALAGCAAAPGPKEVVRFKRPEAGLYSAAAFVPARIGGDWRQVAGYSATASQGCAAGAVRFEETGSGLALRGRLCLNGVMTPVSGPVQVIGPGRLAVPGLGDWWVIWVDSGYRTLAVATPSGTFGFVLDRGAIPYDRLVAAREIFDFNGYSKAGLQPF